MNIKKTASVFCLAISLLASLVFAGNSQSYAKPLFTTKAKFAILIDAETGSVLFAKNADKLMAPASMSKLMTIALLLKALKSGKVKLDDKFRVSVHAWRTGGGPSGTAAIFTPLGKDVLVSDLVQGIAVQSGNDASIVTAEGLAGSEDAFAALMTKEARRIGLKKSTFGNATGLPHPKQLMSARELARLSLYLIQQYPEYYHYFSQKKFKYRRYRFHNRNPLVFKYGADGLKTGATKESGYGLAVSVLKKGRRLVAVVNGFKTKRARRNGTKKLLNWGFRGFKKYDLFKPNEVVGYARVVGGSSSYVSLVGDSQSGVRALLPRFMASKKVPARIIYKGPLIAPVTIGQQIAFLEVRGKGSVINKVPLYAAEDISRAGLIWRGVDTLLFQAFGWLF
ncbi:MAG: D-alanyl-D-alanine carboxypeptidase [Hyphomicrobiaceae bacterium]|nr:D-alanyl-D-alanine carboxypeptidase [Hyphomicrobiaceae bacterium]